MPRARLDDEDAGDAHGEAAAAWRFGEGVDWVLGVGEKELGLLLVGGGKRGEGDPEVDRDRVAAAMWTKLLEIRVWV